MWTCPKCGEVSEDQFDNCWKCAGDAQPPPHAQDVFWLYPFVSSVSLLALGSITQFFWHSPHHGADYFSAGGALVGIATSAVGVWAFLSCPSRHRFAKILTLLLLVGALYVGMFTAGSFVIHPLRHHAA